MGTTGAHTVEGTLLTPTQPPHTCTHTHTHTCMHTHLFTCTHTFACTQWEGGERREERGVKEGEGGRGGVKRNTVKAEME